MRGDTRARCAGHVLQVSPGYYDGIVLQGEKYIYVWLGTKFKKEHIQYLDIKTWRVFIVKYVYLDFTKVRKPPALIRLMMIIYPSNDKESPHDPGCPIIFCFCYGAII